MLQYQWWPCWRALPCKREWSQQISEENAFGDHQQEVVQYCCFINIKNLLLTLFPTIYVLGSLNPGAATVFLARPCPYLTWPWGPRSTRNFHKVQNVGFPSDHPKFEHRQQFFCILMRFSAWFSSMSVKQTRRIC